MIKITVNVLCKMMAVVHLVTCFWMAVSDFGLDQARDIYKKHQSLDNSEKML